MSRFLAAEAKSFLNALLAFVRSKLANFDNIKIHSIRVTGLGGSREGLVELASGFGVPLGDFIRTFSLGLEGDGFLIPIVNGGGDSVHGHNVAHEGGRKCQKRSIQ